MLEYNTIHLSWYTYQLHLRNALEQQSNDAFILHAYKKFPMYC